MLTPFPRPMILVLLMLAGCASADPTPAPRTDVSVPFAPKVGYVVRDLATGEVLAAERADTLFVPASTAKVVPALAALDTLGPDHRFVTTVAATGTAMVSTFHSHRPLNSVASSGAARSHGTFRRGVMQM